MNMNKKINSKQVHTKYRTIQAIEKLIRQTDIIEAELNKNIQKYNRKLSKLSN